MNRDWEELLAIADRMSKSSDYRIQQDSEFVRRLAMTMRDAYVRWLWGY